MSPLLENIIWMVVLAGLAVWIGTVFLPAHKYRTAFLLTVVFCMALRYVLVFYMYKGGTEAAGTDGLIYHEVAKNVADQLRSGVPIWKVEYKYTWYTVLMGMQYAAFGVNRYAASFVNSFISLMSGFVLFGLAHGLKFTWKICHHQPGLHLHAQYDGMDHRYQKGIGHLLHHPFGLVSVFEGIAGTKPKHGQTHTLHGIGLCFDLGQYPVKNLYAIHPGRRYLGGSVLQLPENKKKGSAGFGAMVLITCLVATFTTILVQMDGYHALPLDRSKGGDENISDELGSILSIIMSKDVPEAINGFLTQPHLEKVSRISDISGNKVAITAVKIEQLLWYICLVISIFGIINAILERNPYILGLLPHSYLQPDKCPDL